MNKIKLITMLSALSLSLLTAQAADFTLIFRQTSNDLERAELVFPIPTNEASAKLVCDYYITQYLPTNGHSRTKVKYQGTEKWSSEWAYIEHSFLETYPCITNVPSLGPITCGWSFYISIKKRDITRTTRTETIKEHNERFMYAVAAGCPHMLLEGFEITGTEGNASKELILKTVYDATIQSACSQLVTNDDEWAKFWPTITDARYLSIRRASARNHNVPYTLSSVLQVPNELTDLSAVGTGIVARAIAETNGYFAAFAEADESGKRNVILTPKTGYCWFGGSTDPTNVQLKVESK